MYALRAKRRFLLLRELCGSRPAFSVFNQSSRQAHAIAGDQQRNLDGRHNRMAKESIACAKLNATAAPAQSSLRSACG
jgi:hypothetical protein